LQAIVRIRIPSSLTKVFALLRNQQTGDSRTGKSSQGAGNHGTNCNTGHIARTLGGELIEHTDLVTQGADVGETAESIRYDDLRADGEFLILGLCLEVAIGDEFILKRLS
jgi:hypothetical protein